MDNLDNFLAETPEEGEAVTNEQPAAEAQADAPAQAEGQPETPEQTAQRERDERGRFKAKEEPVMVPLQALHETRDELKALKAELEQYRTQQPQAETPVPDMFENPEGYTQFLQGQIAQASLNDRLNLSEEMVRQSAGDEAVNAAQEWGKQQFASNPAFAQAFYQQRNPYGFLVREYQRHQTMAQIGDDPKTIEEFLAWKQAKENPQPAPVPVPSTLADAQSARGSTEAYTPPTLDQILGRST